MQNGMQATIIDRFVYDLIVLLAIFLDFFFFFFFCERLGHDSPLEDSIEMLCLPLGCSNPRKGCRRNQSE